MTAYDKGVNMSSNFETKEQSPTDAQAKYLGIPDNREPGAGHLDVASKREGGKMSAAVSMVERHNERGEHAPTIGGYKMHDGGMRDNSIDTGTEGE